MDGRSTSTHDSEKLRTRSMEKHGGMAFGFWKTATAVIKPDRQTGESRIPRQLSYTHTDPAM
jgi:hypothetical protein